MSQAIVASVKNKLEAQGVDLAGPCGAMKIVRGVAALIPEAGLYSKLSGNNCEGYAVDILAWPDGWIRDILGDAGGANTPQWPEGEQGDKTRFVSITSPTPPVVGPPDPPRGQDNQDPDVGPWEGQIQALEARIAVLEGKSSGGTKRVSTNRVWGHSHEVEI